MVISGTFSVLTTLLLIVFESAFILWQVYSYGKLHKGYAKNYRAQEQEIKEARDAVKVLKTQLKEYQGQQVTLQYNNDRVRELERVVASNRNTRLNEVTVGPPGLDPILRTNLLRIFDPETHLSLPSYHNHKVTVVHTIVEVNKTSQDEGPTILDRVLSDDS